MNKAMTFGVILGNRGFFPDHLILKGREIILNIFERQGYKAIILGLDDTKNSSVTTIQDAALCAKLFRAHRDEIDGILVTLPNFGEEKIISDAIRLSELNVPVLVHAFDDDMTLMTNHDRRDSFCGKLSLCNNLNQYGIPFSLTELHTVDPEDESFLKDLKSFAAVCRVVKGLRYVRVGALGARPTNFNTVRYSEKLLERSGIAVDTLDLSEAIGRATRLKDDDPALLRKVDEIKRYASVGGVPSLSLQRMARMGTVIDQWMETNQLSVTALQCWTAMEQYYGITPCTLMSMMSNKLVPSACETDVTGVLSMYALSLAAEEPSALLDWNNNYGKDRNKAIFFHCSNLPATFFETKPAMGYSEIFANDVGQENAYGTLSGRIKSGPFTYCRLSTNDIDGVIQAYIGEGEFTKDPIKTFGGYGVAQIPRLQELMQFICRNSFEHHVAANISLVADPVEEAFTRYLKWTVYRHK